MTDKHAIFIRPNGAPIEQDRCTVRVSTHYQEYDSPTTHVTCNYDRSLPAERKPYQTHQRVNFDLVEVQLGGLKWGEVELVLVHEKARLSRDPEVAAKFKEAQDENRIVLYGLDSEKRPVEIGSIAPGRCWLVHFSGPVFVKCTTATALLHITANPA